MINDAPQSDTQAIDFSWLAKSQQHARRTAEALPANKTALFDALARAGITGVTVKFDGYGDSGQIEQIEAHAGDALAELPPDQIEFVEPVYGDPEEVERSTHTVSDAIDTLVFAFPEQTHGNWEDNDGAYGDFTFDVANRSITLDYNGRYTESLYSCHTF